MGGDGGIGEWQAFNAMVRRSLRLRCCECE